MQQHNRWFFGALGAAVFVLCFTPWLIRNDGSIVDGLRVSRDLLHAVTRLDRSGFSELALPWLAWIVPGLALAVLVLSLRAYPRRYGACLGAMVLAVIGLDAWLPHVLNPAHPVVLDLTLAGRAVAAAALALVVLAAIRQRKDESYAIVETRRYDGAAVIDVRQNRWRPMQLLFNALLSVAIVAAALALWLQTYSPPLATLIIVPIAALMFVVIVPCVLAVTRAAVRRAPRARIVIGRRLLTVVAGGERGRYPRAQIGGIYIPQHTSKKLRAYYNHHRGKHKLTLPVAPADDESDTSQGLSLFAESDMSVAINLRDRSIDLARYLTDEQATELRRRVTIRLPD